MIYLTKTLGFRIENEQTPAEVIENAEVLILLMYINGEIFDSKVIVDKVYS